MLINNRIYNIDTNSRHWAISLALIVILSVIMTFIPFVGLCLSLMFFRQRFAPILFIIFSFYFGWFYEPQMDLLVHYEHFHRIADKSLVEQWMDSGTSKYGKEIYPVLFKYFIGLIADNRNFFSACACVVYTSLFIFGVVKPLQPLYMQKMSIPAWLLFLGVIFTVEYYWFLGFRFWSGAFVFTGFYLRYLNSGAVKYLWLSALCICFHYSLLALCVAAVLNLLLRYRFKVYYLILIVSFIVRFAKIAFVTNIAQFGIFENYVKESVRNQNIIQSVGKYAEEIREYGNQFYLLRETIAVFGVLAVIFTVEYYWFLGFRFWSGAFVFTGFYLRYLNSGAVKYLWLSALCICFHYSLLALCVAAVLNLLLRYRFKVYYLILIVSFIVRFAKIAFVTNIAQFGIFENYVKESVRNQNIIQSVGKYAEEIREYGNQFYLLRETIAVFGVLAVIYILYKKIGKEFWEQNVKFWGFCILLLSFANFGYVSLTFYDRFFKLAVLFLYVFTYMWVMDIQSKLSFKSQLLITMVTIIPVLYFIVTPLVEQRHMLFQLNLWFSNLCS